MSPRYFLVLALFVALTASSVFGSFEATNSRVLHGTSRPKRKLSQLNNEARCEWSRDTEQCEVSKTALTQLLSTSNSLSSQFTLQVLSCKLPETEAQCRAANCQWSDERCVPADDVFNNAAVSQCFGGAAVFIQSGQNEFNCRALQTPVDCRRDSTCTWSEARETCFFDLVKSLTGIPTEAGEPQGLEKVLSDMTNQLGAQVNDLFNTTEGAVRWERVLDWTPPQMECPRASPQVCEFASPFLALFPTTVYCRGRYSEGGSELEQCSSDPLCEAWWSNCDTSPVLLRDARRSAYQVFVNAIDDPLISEIMNQTFTCSVEYLEEQCQGNCVWNDREGGCELGRSWMDRKLGEAAGARSEPVCRHMSAVFQSGCLSQYSEDTCLASSQCSWNQDQGGCEPSEVVYRDLVLADDPVLQGRFNRMSRVCSPADNAKSCADL
eukprot:g8173.t1